MKKSELKQLIKEVISENNTSYEEDIDKNKPIIVKGVMGLNSKKFTKKFKNMADYEKWYDKNEDDVEIYQVMNE
jgi:hypothetical protein